MIKAYCNLIRFIANEVSPKYFGLEGDYVINYHIHSARHVPRMKRAILKYTNDLMMSINPFKSQRGLRLIRKAQREVFKIDRKNIEDGFLKPTHYPIETWQVDLLEKGSLLRVQSADWYANNVGLLLRMGDMSFDFELIEYVKNREKPAEYSLRYKWTNQRTKTKLNYCGALVTLTQRDGMFCRIAQDGGLNLWHILELMGDRNEERGTQNTSSMCEMDTDAVSESNMLCNTEWREEKYTNCCKHES